jgi:hypothetical protein
MGWHFGDAYEHVPVPADIDNERAWRKMLREQMRCHKMAMDGELTREKILKHYEELPEAEKDKDWLPFNSMLKLVKRFDGLRIYQFAV